MHHSGAALPAVALLLALTAVPARADPGYYVATPYDNAGKVIVDFRYWTTKARGRGEVVWPEVGLGYGVNSRWTTELFMSLKGSQADAVKPSSLNWQNQVLLTQGEWPLDVALHAQLIHNQESPHGLTLELGPLLQADWGRTQINGNLTVERALSGDTSAPAQMKYQWQLRYRWLPMLHVGLQGFGELGPWDRWASADKQSHRAGPALFFAVRPGGDAVLKLQAAWLEGKTYTRRGHMFTLRATAEF